jgi:hypothetical protein
VTRCPLCSPFPSCSRAHAPLIAQLVPQIGYTDGHYCLTPDDKETAQLSSSSLLYGEILPAGLTLSFPLCRAPLPHWCFFLCDIQLIFRRDRGGCALRCPLSSRCRLCAWWVEVPELASFALILLSTPPSLLYIFLYSNTVVYSVPSGLEYAFLVMFVPCASMVASLCVPSQASPSF